MDRNQWEPEAQARGESPSLACASGSQGTPASARAFRGLNLGCGARFHPAWTNVDLHPQHSSILRQDIAGSLPFADGTFDAVYHSHVLEHLRREQAPALLHECLRVLCQGGTLRIAVPDLEQIARLYLDALGQAWSGDVAAEQAHHWHVLELYDQTTRERPGGTMVDVLRELPATAVAWYRLGADGTVIRNHLEAPAASIPIPSRWRRWTGRLGGWRERLARWLLRDAYALLAVGRFRRAGEVHHWMYDRVSLRRLLTEAGFVDFRVVGPAESDIAGWADFQLDVGPDGAPCKPDSLYVEARKP